MQDAHAERMESNAIGQVVVDFGVVAFEHVIRDVIELGDDKATRSTPRTRERASD